MPIYEYQCKNGHVTDRLRKVEQADDLVECNQCKPSDGSDARAPMTRVLSATKTIFRHHDRTVFK